MTLVELLIGLVIAGIALSLGAGALGAAVDHRSRVNEAAAAVEEQVNIRRALRSWLEAAQVGVTAESVDFEGIDDTFLGLPDDQLSFSFLSGVGAGTLTRARLYIDRDPENAHRGFVVELSTSGSDVEYLELAPNATGLEVRYLSGIYGANTWSDSWVSTSVLPSAVEVVVLADAPEQLPEIFRIPLMVPILSSP